MAIKTSINWGFDLMQRRSEYSSLQGRYAMSTCNSKGPFPSSYSRSTNKNDYEDESIAPFRNFANCLLTGMLHVVTSQKT